jgi:hypothetical protein
MVLHPERQRQRQRQSWLFGRRDLFDRRVIGGMKLIYIKGIYIYIFFFFPVIFLGMYSLLVMILTQLFS